MEDIFTLMVNFICPMCPIYYDRCDHVGSLNENCPCYKEIISSEESNETFKRRSK